MSPDQAAYQIKQGDTVPYLTVGLVYADGTKVDAEALASAASIVFRMQEIDTDIVVQGDMTHVTDDENFPDDNAVRYDWQVGDTDEPGIYLGEIVVVFQDGKRMSFPNNGSLVLAINAPSAAE